MTRHLYAAAAAGETGERKENQTAARGQEPRSVHAPRFQQLPQWPVQGGGC